MKTTDQLVLSAWMCLSILLIVSWCGSVELYVRLRQLSVNSSWCGQWQEAACVCVCEAGCGTSLTSTAELMCSSLRLALKEVKLLVMKARTVLYTCWSTEISLTEVGAIQKHCRNIISALSFNLFHQFITFTLLSDSFIVHSRNMFLLLHASSPWPCCWFFCSVF